MKNIFTEHPRNIGETYLEHMKNAIVMGVMLVIGGLACIVHAIFPFLFTNAATNIVINLTRMFVERMPKDEPRLNTLFKQMNNKFQCDDQSI